MKTAKLIINLFLILICLCFSSELYQTYVNTFSNQFYYFDLSTDENRDQVYSLLIALTDRHDIGVFSVERRTESVQNAKIIVYATDRAENELSSDYCISQGEKKSLFSGTTEITINDFSSIIDDSSIVRFYFTGTKDQVADIRRTIYASFATSYVHKESSSGTEWLVMAVWGVTLLFLLLLTWLDIQFQKKEIFLLMSLGTSTKQIMIKRMLSDAFSFSCVFLIAFFLLDKFIYIGYGHNFSFLAGLLYLLLNSSLYFSLLKYDYKQILYGAHINEKTLANSYVLKAITMIVAIASLSANFALIDKNAQYLSYYDDIYKYSEYGVLDITANTSLLDEKGFGIYTELRNEIFLDYYKRDKIAFATFSAEIEEQPIIILNNNSKEFIDDPSLLENLVEHDFYIFTSSMTDSSSSDFAMFSASNLVFGLDANDISYEIILYDKAELLYFDFRESSSIELGFDKIKNPIFVYCNLSESVLALAKGTSSLGGSDLFGNMLFKLSDDDINEIKSRTGVKDVVYTSLTTLCEQYKSSLLRIVMVNSVISALLLLLEAAIIIAIIKYEYLINAKLLSIKKILGYSLINKNRSIFLLNLLAAIISIVTMIITSLMFKFTSVTMVVFVGFLLMVGEAFIIVLNIIRLEKINIPLILKGGSL